MAYIIHLIDLREEAGRDVLGYDPEWDHLMLCEIARIDALIEEQLRD